MRLSDFNDLPAATTRIGKPATMFTRGGFYTKTSRRKSRGSEKVIDILVAFAHGDPDKTLVMKHIGQLVVAGHADIELLDNGEAEVHFTTGETFLLAATAIFRLT